MHEQAKIYGGAGRSGRTPARTEEALRRGRPARAPARRHPEEGRCQGCQAKLALLYEHIDHVRAALADPASLRFRAGRRCGSHRAPAGCPDCRDGHIYFVRTTGEWDLRVKGSGPRPTVRFRLEKIDGKLVATNREQIETMVGKPADARAGRPCWRRADTSSPPADGTVRRAPLRGAKLRRQLVPIEVDASNRIGIAEGRESIGEMQARITAVCAGRR